MAAHRTLASFFDMRAAWTKWADDMLFTQSMMQADDGPPGSMPAIVPCIFPKTCRNDPRLRPGHQPAAITKTDVAWGSALPLVSACTAALTEDARFAARAAVGASAYVTLLQMFTNNVSTGTPGLLNTTVRPFAASPV